MNSRISSENKVTPMEINSVTQDSTLENQEKRNATQVNETKTFNLPLDPPDENLVLERHNIFEEILTNQHDGRIPVTSIAYCFFGVALSVLCTVLITCWPQHHVIENHGYWYEALILFITGQDALASAILVYTCFMIFGIGTWNSLNTWFVVYVLGAITVIITTYHLYVFWVYVAGYVWPIPFFGYVLASLGWWAIIASFYFRCPKSWRSLANIRRKIIFGILFVNVNYTAEISYKLLIAAFQMVDKNWQWPLFIVVVLVRESNSFLMRYLGSKINGYRDLFADTLANHIAAIRHILFLSVNLGSLTTATTSYLILGSDFVINIFHCFQILWYHNNVNAKSTKKKVNAILSLIVNEGTEALVPISYAMVVTMAYFGPNAEIIGNIKNGLWHYTAIEDFNETLFWLATMFLFDFASSLVSFILLRIFCKINILKMFILIQKHVGFIFAIQQAYFMSEVSIYKYTRVFPE